MYRNMLKICVKNVYNLRTESGTTCVSISTIINNLLNNTLNMFKKSLNVHNYATAHSHTYPLFYTPVYICSSTSYTYYPQHLLLRIRSKNLINN